MKRISEKRSRNSKPPEKTPTSCVCLISLSQDDSRGCQELRKGHSNGKNQQTNYSLFDCLEGPGSSNKNLIPLKLKNNSKKWLISEGNLWISYVPHGLNTPSTHSPNKKNMPPPPATSAFHIVVLLPSCVRPHKERMCLSLFFSWC